MSLLPAKDYFPPFLVSRFSDLPHLTYDPKCDELNRVQEAYWRHISTDTKKRTESLGDKVPELKSRIQTTCINQERKTRKNIRLSSEDTLLASNWSLPNDIENIRQLEKTKVHSRCCKIMAYLINRDEMPIRAFDKLLTPKELIAIAPNLRFLDYQGAFNDWPIKAVSQFFKACQILIPDHQKFVENHKRKIEYHITEFILNYLAKTETIPPKKRFLDFQNFLDLHAGDKTLELLKPSILRIQIKLNIALPNASLIQINTRLKAFKSLVIDDEFLKPLMPEIKKIENFMAKAADLAAIKLKSYLENTLQSVIKESILPKNVINEFLKAIKKRIKDLQETGINQDLFLQLIDKLDDVESSNMLSFPFSEHRFDELKKDSQKHKLHLNHFALDSRLLKGTQATRIPKKLQDELSRIQVNFDKITYSKEDMEAAVTFRLHPEKKLDLLEVLNDETIKMAVPKDSSNSIGNMAIAHLQGDRPSQEDTHIATVLNLLIDANRSKVPLYGIFDGHGGQDGSKFLSQNLKKFLEKELNAALKGIAKSNVKELEAAIFNILKTIFHKITEKYKMIPRVLGGSCACIALVIDEKLWIANLGDSRAILSLNGIPIALSEDAELETKLQIRTIEKRGGFIEDDRVCGELNVSRSACEVFLPVNTRSKLICIPLELLPPGANFLCIACDGVFDVLSTNFVAKNLYKNFKEDLNTLDQMAANLVTTAFNKGSTDNLSVLLVDLNSLIPKTTPAPTEQKP